MNGIRVSGQQGVPVGQIVTIVEQSVGAAVGNQRKCSCSDYTTG